MKNNLLILTLIFVSISALANTDNAQLNTNPNYDAKLAADLGADDYGMKKFVLVILKTGSNTSTDKTLKNAAFKGHIDNISRLVDEKKLIVAGPLGKNDKTYRGIFILDVSSIDQANEILLSDPAIKANYLAAEVIEWYGSAALATYLEASDKIWKVSP
ncbi:MAG: YciI family protein [Colwellia sp.]|nr:YciI family protein [Colwellia sp.]